MMCGTEVLRGLKSALHRTAILLVFASLVSGRDLVLEVSAGAVDRVNVPVMLALPDSIARHAQLYAARSGERAGRRGSGGRRADRVDHSRSLGGWADAALPAVHGGCKTAPAMTAEDDGKHVIIKAGARPVLQYNSAVVPSADPAKPEYRRSGYLHPVYDPEGRPVTDDMAPDHAHQHGVMFPYEKATFEGRPVNFWEPSNGTVEHEAVRSTASGPVFAGFRAVLRHMVNDAPGGPRQAFDETWDVRVYNVADSVVFDLESVQEAASANRS